MVLSLATSRLIVGYGLVETCSGPDLLVGEDALFVLDRMDLRPARGLIGLQSPHHSGSG
ncbi:hypothetical protein [Nocardioides sp. GXZ039]|uniref:hypothetical protein n=1 Tax=Nocardioides sp. GXZ039 TaxID=3136018 RepID=UPI0030F4173B